VADLVVASLFLRRPARIFASSATSSPLGRPIEPGAMAKATSRTIGFIGNLEC
jgi:hypothetical protein